MKQETINVGIKTASSINFSFNGAYRIDGIEVTGDHTAIAVDGKIKWMGGLYDSLCFEPLLNDNRFTLKNVVIGIGFHWERMEDQQFAGALKIIVDGDNLIAVNHIGIEDYLLSVISSEMSATASLELLKAHAVISRSWLMAQIKKNRELAKDSTPYCACTITEDETVKWYDREDHTLFDICADDHCQRYQGTTRQTTPSVATAIKETWGQVLMFEDKLCDARFSKCCGGVYETFENCWEPVKHPYLVPLRDAVSENDFPDLTIEKNAIEWIKTSPDAFCNTKDPVILSQVLNNYDQETSDFYRWSVTYSQKEISELIARRSGNDYGKIRSLEALERGTSGRIVRLRIEGEKKTHIIGKELEIRRTLSESHLYSSAFVIEPGEPDADGFPTSFTLRGAGWGHGVGLCQIGAAVMGSKGYSYEEILFHYFIGARLEKAY